MTLRGTLKYLSLPGLFFLLLGLYLLSETFAASLGLLLAMPLVGVRDLEGVQDLLLNPSDADLEDPAVLFAIKLINIMVSCGKLLGGLLFLYLIQGHPVAQIGRERRPAWTMLLLGAAVMISAGPLIDWLNAWNQDWSFTGKWFSAARDLEDQATRLTKALLAPASPIESLTTFIMVAVLAAVWEELVFRGILQRLIEAWTRNGHIAIWTAALIFSAIHLQFFSFVPRLLLGALLGYLYWWSRNLWVPILAHFLNNAIFIVYSWVKGVEKAAESGQTEWYWALAAASALLFLLLMLYRIRERSANLPWAGLDPATNRLSPPKEDRKPPDEHF